MRKVILEESLGSVNVDLQIKSALRNPDVSNLHRNKIIKTELQHRESSLIF